MPERLENLDWRNMVLKRMFFHVELNVLSILRLLQLSKSVVKDGKPKGFVAEFIWCLLFLLCLMNKYFTTMKHQTV